MYVLYKASVAVQGCTLPLLIFYIHCNNYTITVYIYVQTYDSAPICFGHIQRGTRQRQIYCSFCSIYVVTCLTARNMDNFNFFVRGLRLLWFMSAPPDKDGNKLNPHKWVLSTLTVSQRMKNFRLCWKAKIYCYNYLVRHFSPF
jgi:hypothetical protein